TTRLPWASPATHGAHPDDRREDARCVAAATDTTPRRAGPARVPPCCRVLVAAEDRPTGGADPGVGAPALPGGRAPATALLARVGQMRRKQTTITGEQQQEKQLVKDT